MKVITENEIIVQKGTNMDQIYSPANGWDKLKEKAKGLVGSGKVSGALNALQGGGTSPGITNTPPPPPPPPALKKPKMSNGAKIGIAVAAVAIIGVGIYLFVKKKKGGK